ncbi:MAG: tRNA (N(6)-L-threonylcarbamoyladenosine(37)-C(2))-methylthiotransferase MtaB [Bacteroidales bacterium]|nr:tRNA (N(6)-L-threonylcarbamoyladenosine(37)-C(2))-methylthiotransferase MtaB [Bacteroidales bacterium]
MNEKKKFAIVTLGCKLNYAESASMAREYLKKGYRQTTPSAKADVYIINTCSVTEHADKKSRQAIRKVLRQNPDAYVVVTGCSAQLRPKVLGQMEGVGALLGTGYRDRVVDVTEQGQKGTVLLGPCHADGRFFPAYSAVGNRKDRTRAFLKVQDGCDYRCTYCTVPLARGKSRNISIHEVVKQAEEIAASGVKEIVLTGVNTGDFGKTTGETFLELLEALSGVSGIARYRVSSVEPNLLTEEIIRFIAETENFLPHFHLPLQSGSVEILKKMRRRYHPQLFKERIRYIRSLLPYAFIGVDVIAGFPGETEEDFFQTYNLLKEVSPSFLHVFPFSLRPGTRAAELPVSERIKDNVITERTNQLSQLSDVLYTLFMQANKGRKEEVLFEGRASGGKMHGYTRNYIRVERPYDEAKINTIEKILL